MYIHERMLQVFTGNSHQTLAADICGALQKQLKEPIRLGNIQVKKFADGEIGVSLEDSVRGNDVFVIQSTCRPVNQNLMELLIMVDAMKRASAGRITAVIPYFGYARQDRKAQRRDPITAKLVSNMITAAGVDRVLTMDLHAAQIQGFFDIPVDNLEGYKIFAHYYEAKFGIEQRQNMVVVSPDVGSVSRARKFSEKLHMGLAIVDKRRPSPNESVVKNIIGDVRGKDCILCDDMVDTAGSLCNAAEALIQTGGARSVHACATHGVLSGPALDRLNSSCIQELALLDTIPPVNPSKCDRLHYLSVAPLFADFIKRTHREEPFEDEDDDNRHSHR